MLRIFFHIFILAQSLILLLMAHIPANGELGMVVLYADGGRVSLTFRMQEDSLAYVTSQCLALPLSPMGRLHDRGIFSQYTLYYFPSFHNTLIRNNSSLISIYFHYVLAANFRRRTSRNAFM
jgi:hypothetical protein